MTRLDSKSIAEYSKAYSQKLTNEFFDNKDTISGGEILNISAVDQVNLFALKAIFESWKTTAENFKSSFFDFENEKVKEALQSFMNVTSQHIAVKKADFQPILSKATFDTITLALSPSEYYDKMFRDLPGFKCTINDVLLLQKYTRLNTAFLQGFKEKFGNENEVFTNQALDWLKELLEKKPLDDADVVLNQFEKTLTFDKNQFFKNKDSQEIINSENTNASFFDNIAVPTPNNISNNGLETTDIEVLSKVVPVKVDETVSTLNEQYSTDKPTLHEQFQEVEQSQNLADLHQNTPIKNLAGFISLNQKFVFINKLFNGDSAAYNETIDILEKCKDSQEALNLLKYKYAPKYQWNLNSDEADELIDILKRKF